MLIGLISDTHDNLPMIEKAVKILNTEKVNVVLHAGDFISAFTVKKFSKLNTNLIGVFGNNDGDIVLLKKAFSRYNNLKITNGFKEIIFDDIRIGLLHGDNEDFLKYIIESGFFNMIVYGHTHRLDIYRNGITLVINPGEVCGYITGESTIVIVDINSFKTKIINLL